MAMLDRILSGFKRLGGRAREYIHETAAIALNFFSRAGDMEAELESSEALKFWNVVNGMKDSIRNLIRWKNPMRRQRRSSTISCRRCQMS